MDLLTRIALTFQGKKIPVYWGNRHWYDYQESLTPHGKLIRLNPSWINYRKFCLEETTKLLQDGHPEADYRHRFHKELLALILKGLQSVPRSERVCLFTSGGTASGKTSAVDEIVGKTISIKVDGGLRIDYDRLKRLLPEYDLMLSLGIKEAAQCVQSESSKLGAKLFKKAYQVGAQIIFEQTLEKPKMPLEYIKDLKRKGYEVVIAATHVTEAIGQQRAQERAQKMGRYIPPEIISGIYSRVPTTLFHLRDKADQIYLFDNCGSGLELMFSRNQATGAEVVNHELYGQYLDTVGRQLDLCL